MVNRVASESLASPRGADLLVRETLVASSGCPLSPPLYFSRVTHLVNLSEHCAQHEAMSMSMTSLNHPGIVPIKSSVCLRDRSDSRRPHD